VGVFDFLKGRSRVISLIDLKREGELVLVVHIYSKGRWSKEAPPRVVAPLRFSEISEDNDLF
jgi:hypothetical protein